MTKAFSGGTIARISPQQLRELAETCRTRNVMVHTVEALELGGDCEITRTDMALHGPAEAAGRAWEARVQFSCDEAVAIVRRVMDEGLHVIFEVWLSRE